MAKNVTQVFESETKSLLEKLMTNPDLCNFVLGLLSRCIVLCTQMGKPIEGIEIEPMETEETHSRDLIIRATVKFHTMAMTSAAMWPLQSDFAHYTRSKAYGLALALQKNPKLAVFFQRMIERIDRYAVHRGLDFSLLYVKQAIITTTNRIVLKVGKQLLDN